MSLSPGVWDLRPMPTHLGSFVSSSQCENPRTPQDFLGMSTLGLGLLETTLPGFFLEKQGRGPGRVVWALNQHCSY